MRLLGRVLAVAAVLVVLAVVGVWLASDWLIEHGRQFAEEALTHALDQPVEIPVLTVTWSPPVVHVERFTIGPDGNAVRIGVADVHLLLNESLHELRPVADVVASGVWVDPARIGGPPSPGPHGPHVPVVLPSFQVRDVRVTDASLRLSDPPERIELHSARTRGTVEITRLTHRLGIKVNARDVVLNWNDRILALDVARARAQDTAQGLELTYAFARGDGVHATARAKSGATLTHIVHADVDVQRLAFVDALFNDFGGRLGVIGTLNGKLEELNLDANATLQGLTLAQRPVGDFQGHVRTSRDHLEVSDGRLQGLGGTALIAGRLDFPGTAPFSVHGTVGDLQVPLVTELAGGVSAPAGSTSGRFDLKGSLTPLSLDWDAGGVFRGPQAATVASINWTSTGRYDGNGGALEVFADQGAVNSVRGRAAVGRDEALTGTLSARIGDTVALRSLTGPVDVAMVRGSLSFDGTLGGTLKSPTVTASVDGRNVQAFGVTARTLSGSVRADTTRIQADRIVAVLDKGNLQFDGTLGLAADSTNSWQAQVHDFPTSAAVAIADAAGVSVPLWGGQINASIAGSGPWSRISLSGVAGIQDFFVGSEPVESLSVQLQGLWPSWTLDAHVSHRPDETLTATVTGKGTDEIALKAAASDWDLSRFRGASLATLAGHVSLQTDVRGPPTALSGHIGFNGSGLIWERRRFGDVHLDLTGDRGRWRLNGDIGGLIGLGGTLNQQPGYPFTLVTQWTDADLGPFLGTEQPIALDTTGRVEVRGRLDALRQIDADIDIGKAEIHQGDYGMRATEPIRIHGRGGQFTIDSLSLGGDEIDLRLEGAWGTNGEINLQLRAKGDLRVVEVFSQVISAQGAIDASAAIKRSHGEWNLSGTISLANGDMDFGLPIAMTDTNARFALAGRTIRIEQFTGDTGGGTFTVGGDLDVVDGPDITWKVDQMSTGLVESLEDEVSGQGTIKGSWSDFTVGGRIDINKALYTRKIKVTDLLPSFQKSVRPPPQIEPEAANIHLDLWIHAPGDIFVDNNFAKLELRTNLHVTGTVRDVVLSGPIELIDGTVTVQNRTFDITTGVIDFRPELGLTPTVNIRGETVVNSKESSRTITVDVSGTAEDFRIALGGDDAGLSQTDIVSVLATGQTRAESQVSGTGGVSASDLVSLAPGLYQDKLQEGIQQFIPLDTIEVEPTLSRSTGTLQPRVSIGKDLTESLNASIASTFGVETYRSAQLRYQLTPRTTLVGLWESATSEQSGAFGGEIKFQYRYIGWPRFSLIRPWGVVDVD